jgi:DNA-binding response OmpR family regulator
VRYVNEAGYVHAYAYRVRHKLGDEDGSVLVTARGVGFKLATGRE